MDETKDTKYLSDVIDYKEDIKDYTLIQIYSGVGSGKNYWVQTLAEQGKNILFITSRKITAEVQDDSIDGVEVDLKEWHKHTINGKPVGGDGKYRVSRTNAWIEKFAKYKYDPDKIETHIWKYFDYIFLDEAHSVATDATFADSSFQVWRFMSWVASKKKYERCEKCGSYEKCRSCRVILMSGTPEPIERLIPERTRESKDYNYLDYFEKCNHVEPLSVIIRQEENETDIAKVIKKYDEKGIRIIYFTCSIGNIVQLIAELSKQGICKDKIGVSFTDEGHNGDFTADMLEKKKRIEESLKTIELLPDDVRIFLTTTKNKEGINIRNKDIKVMFAESSQKAELIQMAGRVRNGLDELNIMYKLSRPHGKVLNKWRRNFAEKLLNDRLPDDVVLDGEKFDKKWLDHINYNYSAFAEEEKCDKATARKIIEDIEKCFPYVRYDFFRQRFQLFEGKINGEKLAIDDRYNLDEWVDRWYDERIDKGVTILPPGYEEFQTWFPYSRVSLAKKPLTEKEIIKRVMDGYFKEHKDFVDIEISTDVRDKIMADLNALVREQIPDYNASQPKTFLEKGGYSIVTKGHKKENYRYTIIRLMQSKENDKIKG